MKIFCPKCNQKYDLSEEFIGEEVECFVCNNEFEVKAPADLESQAAPVSPAPVPEKPKKSKPGIGKTVPTTLATPLAVAKKAVIIPEEKPATPVVKKAIITTEDEECPDEQKAPEKNAEPVEKTDATQPVESKLESDEEAFEDKAPLPVEEKLALARKQFEQENEGDEPQVTVTRSLFKLPSRASENLIQDEEDPNDLLNEEEEGEEDDLPSDSPETGPKADASDSKATETSLDTEEPGDEIEDAANEETLVEKAKKAFENSKKVTPPKGKKQHITVLLALLFSLLGNAGVYHSAKTFYFLPALIFLIIAFFLSLAAIYQRQVIIGIGALLLTLALPSYVFTENFDKGIATLLGNAPIEYEEEIDGSAESESEEEKKTDISDIYGYPGEDDQLPQLSTFVQKIQGAFGFKLGDKFNTSSALEKINIATGEILYRVKPKEKFRNFTHYYIMISPVSKKIYAIWAEVDMKTRPKAEREFRVVLTLLEKKYETKATSGIIPSMLRKSIKINNRTISLISSISGEVKLRYTDDLLKAKAEKESVLQEASKESTRSL